MKNLDVSESWAEIVNYLNYARRAFLCLALLVAYFIVLRRPETMLGFKRGKKGR